ncbi:MAG: hypothetical protein ACFFAN_11555 [Promethearchaeota archaeon]
MKLDNLAHTKKAIVIYVEIPEKDLDVWRGVTILSLVDTFYDSKDNYLPAQKKVKSVKISIPIGKITIKGIELSFGLKNPTEEELKNALMQHYEQLGAKVLSIELPNFQ